MHISLLLCALVGSAYAAAAPVERFHLKYGESTCYGTDKVDARLRKGGYVDGPCPKAYSIIEKYYRTRVCSDPSQDPCVYVNATLVERYAPPPPTPPTLTGPDHFHACFPDPNNCDNATACNALTWADSFFRTKMGYKAGPCPARFSYILSDEYGNKMCTNATDGQADCDSVMVTIHLRVEPGKGAAEPDHKWTPGGNGKPLQLAMAAVAAQPDSNNDPECIEVRDTATGLCVVNITSHKFAPPNPILPESIRGVYWIDSGSDGGYSNPWVDLNFLANYPDTSSYHSKEWFVLDHTPHYQSWQDVPGSITYVKRMQETGSRSTVAKDLTVTFAACGFTCGTKYEVFAPLPFTSPSKQVGPNEFVREAAVAGVVVSSWKAYRIIDSAGDRTEFFDKMVEKYNGQVLMLPRAS